MERTKKTVVVEKEIESLIPTFLANREQDLLDLVRAFEINDYKLIEKIGHRLKGNAGGHGFTELSSIGLKLEKAAKERRPISELSNYYRQIREYLDNIEIIYEEE